MSHVREQIRDAAHAAVTGLITTGARAYASRVYPMTAATLPGLIVYTKSEESEPATMGRASRRIARRLSLVVEGYVKLTAGASDKADTICAEVEAAIVADAALQALVKDVYLSSTEIKLMGDAEKPVAVVTMNFSAIYHTAENAPQTAI